MNEWLYIVRSDDTTHADSDWEKRCIVTAILLQLYTRSATHKHWYQYLYCVNVRCVLFATSRLSLFNLKGWWANNFCRSKASVLTCAYLLPSLISSVCSCLVALPSTLHLSCNPSNEIVNQLQYHRRNKCSTIWYSLSTVVFSSLRQYQIPYFLFSTFQVSTTQVHTL